MNRPDRSRWARAACVAFAVGLVATYAAVIDTGGRDAQDLAVYHATAKVWRAGDDPRQCAALKQVAEAKLGGCAVSPAWLTPVTAPLASASLAALSTPWRAALAAATGLAAGLWSLRASWWAALGVGLATAALYPTLATITGGNLEAFVALLLGAAAASPRYRGLFVAVAGAVKLTPWLLAPVSRWRPTAAAIGFVACTDLWIDGALFLGPRGAASGDADAIQPTLLGVIRTIRGSRTDVDAAELTVWAAIAAVAVGTATARTRHEDEDARFLAAALGLLVLTPRGWHYLWLGALGPLGVAWASRPLSLLGLAGLLAPGPFAPWAVAALTWTVWLFAPARSSGATAA